MPPRGTNADAPSSSGDSLAQADHITVAHGSLTVDVPRSIFRGPECEIDPERAAPFRRMVQDRYPWLNKARKEMIRVRDEETNGRSHSANLASKGKLDEAIAHLQLHLESNPRDADSWYKLGELLCKAGRADEGYKALNTGRKLAEDSQQRRGR